MSWNKQYQFVWDRLKASAASVGIDLDRSEFGLVEIFNRSAKWGMELEPEHEAEADRLWCEFGSTDEGIEMLFALGEACNYADGWTWDFRDFETPWGNEEELIQLGWGSLKERSLCDFAMHTGAASSACYAYINRDSAHKKESMFSSLGRKGAHVRHAPMRNLRDWAVAQFKLGSWKSANAAAHDLAPSVIEHGRKIGANLSKENAQRTIAEWIRKYV